MKGNVTVCVMEFLNEHRNFHFLKELELPAVPSKDDKIVFNIEGIGYVFKVYDVHYAPTGIDVNVIRISTITEYNSSGFPDIVT